MGGSGEGILIGPFFAGSGKLCTRGAVCSASIFFCTAIFSISFCVRAYICNIFFPGAVAISARARSISG